jgi:hypothetical protein
MQEAAGLPSWVTTLQPIARFGAEAIEHGTGWEISEALVSLDDVDPVKALSYQTMRVASRARSGLTVTIVASGHRHSPALDSTMNVVMASRRDLTYTEYTQSSLPTYIANWWDLGGQTLTRSVSGVSDRLELRDLTTEDWQKVAEYIAEEGVLIHHLIPGASDVDWRNARHRSWPSAADPGMFVRELAFAMTDGQLHRWKANALEAIENEAVLRTLAAGHQDLTSRTTRDHELWRSDQLHWREAARRADWLPHLVKPRQVPPDQ